MNGDLIESALTAFVISSGGALFVILGNGDQPNARGYVIAAVVGAVSAAKDVRSFKKMPPVPANGDGAVPVTIKDEKTTPTLTPGN